MVVRSLRPLDHKSFFLFGARGTGKTTFWKDHFSEKPRLVFDLLDPELTDDLALHPNRFRDKILEFKKTQPDQALVIVDEVQKIPQLLDIVHQLIESDNIQFLLTGSSARRLKQRGVNLLAGRALVYHLYPLTAEELGDHFDLQKALERGTLPASYLATSLEESKEFLKAYALTYLEKEIQQEQWVRQITPFRRFLRIAGQMNGKIINKSRIARDVGVEDMTIASYYEILVDTLMGFELYGFHRSSRKQMRKAPKFYLFDSGIKRALDKTLDIPLLPQTSAYGEAFEHWVIAEIMRRADYARKDWEFFYYEPKGSGEIDLIIDRPGKGFAAIEIKSASRIFPEDARSLENIDTREFQPSLRLLLSQDPLSQKIGTTQALPWMKGIETLLS